MKKFLEDESQHRKRLSRQKEAKASKPMTIPETEAATPEKTPPPVPRSVKIRPVHAKQTMPKASSAPALEVTLAPVKSNSVPGWKLAMVRLKQEKTTRPP